MKKPIVTNELKLQYKDHRLPLAPYRKRQVAVWSSGQSLAHSLWQLYYSTKIHLCQVQLFCQKDLSEREFHSII